MVFTIPSKFHLPGFEEYSLFLCVFFFNVSPDPCPKLANNDFDREEKHAKTGVLNILRIPTVVFKT